MCMFSRNKIKSPEEQKLGEGGDDKQVIKLMWPKTIKCTQRIATLLLLSYLRKKMQE